MSLDLVARGQAAQALGGKGRAQRFAAVHQRFLRHLAEANARGNPHSLGAMAAPPTVTSTTTTPAQARVPASATVPADYEPYLRMAGGWPRISSGALYGETVTRTIGAATGGDSSVAYASCVRLVFLTDDPSPTFGLQMTQLSPFRLIVDGQYVDKAGHLPASTALAFWTLAFGSSAVRRIEIELQGGPATSGGSASVQQLRFFYPSSAAYSVWAPPPLGLRVIQLGDSYTFGPIAGHVATSMLGDGLGRIAGDYCGIADWWPSGMAGTGWLWRAGSGTNPNLLDRVSDVTAWAPDIVITTMGVNDLVNDGQSVGGITVSAATAQARVQAVLSMVRAALPAVPVVVLGPWRFPATSGTVAASYEAAIAAGAAAAGDPLIAFQPTIATSWLTGNGNSGSPNGSGNGDRYYSGSDVNHPSIAGHAYLGRRVAQALAAGMETMRGRVG